MVQLGVIGQIARPVSDIQQAVDFYGGVLGLPHLYTFGDLAFFDLGTWILAIIGGLVVAGIYGAITGRNRTTRAP